MQAPAGCTLAVVVSYRPRRRCVAGSVERRVRPMGILPGCCCAPAAGEPPENRVSHRLAQKYKVGRKGKEKVQKQKFNEAFALTGIRPAGEEKTWLSSESM